MLKLLERMLENKFSVQNDSHQGGCIERLGGEMALVLETDCFWLIQ